MPGRRAREGATGVSCACGFRDGCLQPMFEDDLKVKDVYDRALAELIVPWRAPSQP